MAIRLKKKNKLTIFLLGASSVVFAGILFGSISLMALFGVYSALLPSPSKLIDRNIEQSTKIYDRNGKLLYEVFADKNRTLVELDQISPHILHATLSAEDADFYVHKGFNLVSLARAVYNTVTRKGLQGGSTLTQQLVKNALLSSERTINRKIKEFVLSLQIEKKYTKDDILKMYLNETPYGGTSYGVEAAAQYFFGKKAKDLDLAESALIAGLPQSPSYYSPFGANPENAVARQHYVLWLMRTKGWMDKNGKRVYISEEEYQSAKNEALKYATVNYQIKAPHFVMYIKALLSDTYGEDLIQRGGLNVTTSLDLDLQERAQKILKEEVEKSAYLDVGNAALVALNPKNGQILAMVGSKDYFDMENDGNVNVALSLRQPGSAIKPITYLAAFENGFTPASVLYDVPMEFDGGVGQPNYKPLNYTGEFGGPIQIRYALAGSINIPAVKMLKLVGIDKVLDLAKRMGISTLNEPQRYGLSLTLGGGEIRLLELTNAFGVLANSGVYNSPVSILKVSDSRGNIIYEFANPVGKKVVNPEYCYLISDILSDNNARAPVFGPNSALVVPGHTVAVKTGTTNDIRDNWTIGYTPSIVVGVWAGNNDNSPMAKGLASGVTGAAPVWQKVMVDYLKDKKDEKFEKLDNVVSIQIGKISGMKQVDDLEDGREEKFVKGTEPTIFSDNIVWLSVCKDGGDYKLAKDCDEDADIDDKVFFNLKAELPEWQKDLDSWIEENIDDDDYFPPL